MLNVLKCHHKNLTLVSPTMSQINFPDLHLMCFDNKLHHRMFGKPTETNCTINNICVNPLSQKTFSFRSMVYRAHSILLQIERKN